MKRGLIKNSIQRKLIIAILSGILMSSLLGISVSSWREVQRFTETKKHEIEVIAEVFAATVSEPLAQNDRRRIYRSLSAISRFPSFTYARVIDSNGRVVAELGSAVVLKTQTVLPIFLRSRIQVVANIVSGGRPIGQLMLVANSKELKYQLLNNMFIGILAALLASLVGIFIALKFQKRITAPLINLTGALNRIRETQDFSHPVKQETDDETGLLVSAFNDMQNNIRVRDHQLAEYMENLEQTVETRTSELVVAKEAAEHANAAKSDFLATMSHEIRTPMNGMLVMAELLANAQLTDQNRRYADVIVKSGQSLLTIINDILDFSKIESGKLELEAIELDPASGVDDILSLFLEKAARQNIELASYVDPNVPAGVLGDPVRLNQVLTNLVNNALKFTKEGSVLVEIFAHPHQRLDEMVELEFAVSDTGIGIPADKCDTIFDAFSQADQSTTRNFGGTGLGLAICQRLVTAMGGNIAVSSEVGQGSRFSFCINTAITKAAPQTAAPLPDRIRRAAIITGGSANDQILERYLQDYDVEVQFIHSAKVKADDLHSFNMLIGDAGQIGVLDSQPLQRNGDDHPYIVCLSPLGDMAFEALVENSQADELLTLPLSRHELGGMLERLDSNRPLRTALLAEKHQDASRFASFKGAHVLVADDSAVNQEVALAALQRLDITCDVVENGQLALDAVRLGDYDAVLMDCSMPVMDGFTATREIRRLEADSGRSPLPVIALTAHVAGTPAADWRSSGMDDYLTKPFRLNELAELLGQYLPQVEPSEQSDEEATAYPKEHEELLADSDDSAADPVIDDAVLNSYAEFQEDGGAALISRLLDLFLEHAPEAFSTIETVAGGTDLDELANAAHALKSMARNIGAVRLSTACDRLEQHARQQTGTDILKAVTDIKSELDNARQHTKAIYEQYSLKSALQ